MGRLVYPVTAADRVVSSCSGDLLAREVLELADEVTFPTPCVDLCLVVVGAKVVIVSVGIGEQAPDDGQY